MVKVQPIRQLEHIRRIRRNLKKPKTAVFYTLFVVGVNTNLRISDLRNLTWKQVWADGTRELREHIYLKEKKTGKTRQIWINEKVKEALQYLIENIPVPEGTNPIFRNPRIRKVYSREYLSRRMGVEARKVGVQDPIGIHSLRKTWGYHAVVTFDQPITIVQAAFNHASQGETMDYLCITTDQIEDVPEMYEANGRKTVRTEGESAGNLDGALCRTEALGVKLPIPRDPPRTVCIYVSPEQTHLIDETVCTFSDKSQSQAIMAALAEWSAHRMESGGHSKESAIMVIQRVSL
jgi:hypothetical protein